MKNRMLVSSVLLLGCVSLVSAGSGNAGSVSRLVVFATPGVMSTPENPADMTGKMAKVNIEQGLQHNLIVSFQLVSGNRILLPLVTRSFQAKDKAAAVKLYSQLTQASQGCREARGTVELVQVATLGKIFTSARLVEIKFFSGSEIIIF